MDILISIAGKIAEYVVEPVGRELGYVCFIHANFQKLKTQVEKLKDTRGSVQHKVFLAKRNGEDIKSIVEKWLSEVDEFVEKSEAILANEGEHGRLCSTNLVQRYKLSRKISKMTNESVEMKNEGDNFDTVSFKGSVSLVESSRPKGADFLDFGSRNSTMEQIMEALCDDNVQRVGVYGMGGVGKTMLVKEIKRKMKKNKSFDEVVISSISQTPDVKIIQGELADMLDLKFEHETIQGRASMLRKRLKMEKSILVILDDVWDKIDLHEIGIPSSVEDHERCKILFTSRDKDLMSNDFCVNECFEIKLLGENESWNLFKAMTREITETSDLKPIAIDIVRECGGLPIALVTVASALRNKSLSDWKVALDELKRKDVVVSIKGMEKYVYSSLQLSYDFLDNEEVKLLFLLCSIFPEDFDIAVEELQIYAISIGFLNGVDTIAQGRRKITKLVEDLRSSSLLLQSKQGTNDFGKMHDMVREIAIFIASKNAHIRTLCYVKRSNKEWEEKKLSGNYTAVSLVVEDSIHHDPIPKLMFAQVELFMLSKTSTGLGGKMSVVKTICEEMKELKGLVLKNLEISTLLPSLYSFPNIRLLRLISCELGSIEMIGELKKLEILILSNSKVVEIPATISQLTKLKVLDLFGCYALRVIPQNILSKLTKLEELNLQTFNRWEEEDGNSGIKNASLSELECLPHLNTLILTIQDEKIMPKNLFSREVNLEKFNITIGHSTNIGVSDFKKLDVKMKSEKYFNDWIKLLLKWADEVSLEGPICSKALQYWELLDANHHDLILPLKHLCLSDNSEFQHIIIHEKNKSNLRKCLYSKLDFLYLEKLQNLKSIIDGHGYGVGESSFNNLRNVKVFNCQKLETLFCKCILDDVLNLEKIDINYCTKITEVMSIVMENQATNNHIIDFTRLKFLSLRDLPQLQTFCSKIEKHEQLSQLSTISNSFFSQQVSLPDLEALVFKGAKNLKMIWSNVLIIPNSFSKLKEVHIRSCNNLESVFPPNMINILTRLNILSIANCELLEGIFEVQDQPISVTTTTPIVLRSLSKLELRNLPKLEYVWSKNPCDQLLPFENIKSLFIRNCSKLKGEYFSSIKIVKQLETLVIDMKQLMEVFGKEKSDAHHMLSESKQLETSKVAVIKELGDGFELFPKLKTFYLYGYIEYNSTHLPIEIVRMIYRVDKFLLEGAFIEEIFPMNKMLINEMKKQYARSSKISRNWTLFKLPKLKHLWNSSSGCSQQKDDETNSSILQDLFHLEISKCGGLSSLASSSSVSFTNLKYLKVEECGRLTHLLSPSVATTLVQLVILILYGCKRMSTVIEQGDDDDEEIIIVFNKLQRLIIDYSPQLTSFHSGKCIIKFPCLNLVRISRCPNMEIFSFGFVSTPHLKHQHLLLHNVNRLPNVSQEMIVEDINIIVTEYWKLNNTHELKISYLFTQQNLEENQSENPSSHVEVSISNLEGLDN